LPTAWHCRRCQRHHKAHIGFLNAGGLGIPIGDGQLTNCGLEQIFEGYFSYALNRRPSSLSITSSSPIPAKTPTAGRPTSSPAVCNWQF
jgi:hypothetical protein